MTERERLIELLQSVPVDCTGCRGVGAIADYLIENGAIVKGCEICEHIYACEKRGYILAILGKRFTYCPECGKKLRQTLSDKE